MRLSRFYVQYVHSFGSTGSTQQTTTATFVQGSTKFKDLPESFSKRFAQFEYDYTVYSGRGVECLLRRTFMSKQEKMRDDIAEHLKIARQREKISVDSLSQVG